MLKNGKVFSRMFSSFPYYSITGPMYFIKFSARNIPNFLCAPSARVIPEPVLLQQIKMNSKYEK